MMGGVGGGGGHVGESLREKGNQYPGKAGKKLLK